jgi:hypothetical protein
MGAINRQSTNGPLPPGSGTAWDREATGVAGLPSSVHAIGDI